MLGRLQTPASRNARTEAQPCSRAACTSPARPGRHWCTGWPASGALQRLNKPKNRRPVFRGSVPGKRPPVALGQAKSTGTPAYKHQDPVDKEQPPEFGDLEHHELKGLEITPAQAFAPPTYTRCFMGESHSSHITRSFYFFNALALNSSRTSSPSETKAHQISPYTSTSLPLSQPLQRPYLCLS